MIQAAVAKKKWEVKSEDEDSSVLKEVESTKLETDSSSREEEEERDSGEEKDEAPQMVPPKRRQRHIIEDDADELEEEQEVKPLISFLSSKGKEKVLDEDDSEKDPRTLMQNLTQLQ